MSNQPTRNQNLLRARTNMADGHAESWRPQSHAFAKSGFQSLADSLRRFLDLQSGSLWRDLSAELPDVRGTALDVGCGAQPFRQLFHRSVQYIGDRKSTRLNSSHLGISYAVFCLKTQ